jgi:two-component system, chemotaxis family, protein-glutamate methylesterase/glutaminase
VKPGHDRKARPRTGSRASAEIRVLLADDSDLFAEEIRRVLEGDPHIHVVGRATNGREAVEKTAKLHPDLVVMDVMMPVMDGLSAIQTIMADHPTPILVMTSDPRGRSGELALEATRRGALDLVMKAAAGEEEEALRSRVRFLAGVAVVRHQDARRKTHQAGASAAVRPPVAERKTRGAVRAPSLSPIRAIGIVASTGGPPALASLVESLPLSLKAGIVLVQHLPAGGFAESLADWLGHVCAFRVSVAREGEILEAGRILIAPDNRHVQIQPSGCVVLSQEPPRKGFRPSGDVLLSSLARSFGSEALGIVLTGIGSDGSEGLLELRRAGGRTMAQDAASSLIFGMPQAAWDCGAAERLVSLDDMAEAVVEVVGSTPPTEARR